MKEFNWKMRDAALNKLPADELVALTSFWSDHEWALVVAVSGMSAEERAKNKRAYRSLEKIVRDAAPSLGTYNFLPFFNSTLGLSEENLAMLSKLAPEDLKKGALDSEPPQFGLKD